MRRRKRSEEVSVAVTAGNVTGRGGGERRRRRSEYKGGERTEDIADQHRCRSCLLSERKAE
jgi:hypothetical protein